MSSKAKAKSSTTKTKKSKRTTSPSPGSGAQFLLTCDPPMKQFIIHLNDQKIADKKFIIEDLDTTHLLIKGDARDEINRKVEDWMDNVSYMHIYIYYVVGLIYCICFSTCVQLTTSVFSFFIRHTRMYILPSRGLERTWTHRRILDKAQSTNNNLLGGCFC